MPPKFCGIARFIDRSSHCVSAQAAHGLILPRFFLLSRDRCLSFPAARFPTVLMLPLPIQRHNYTQYRHSPPNQHHNFTQYSILTFSPRNHHNYTQYSQSRLTNTTIVLNTPFSPEPTPQLCSILTFPTAIILETHILPKPTPQLYSLHTFFSNQHHNYTQYTHSPLTNITIILNTHCSRTTTRIIFNTFSPYCHRCRRYPLYTCTL